jgi:hypothetical protein
MEVRRERAASWAVAGLLAPLVLTALLALAACCSSVWSPQTCPTTFPTRTSPGPALSFPPQHGTAQGFVVGTDGLVFVPWVDIEVTGLGYYDEDGDGLVARHTVGIFEKSTEQLVTPSVTVDGQSTLEGLYRYEPIAPVVLKAGRTYVVAGDNPRPFDKQAEIPKNVVWAPELRFVAYKVSYGTFRYPRYLTAREGDDRDWIAANFMFMPVLDSSPSP